MVRLRDRVRGTRRRPATAVGGKPPSRFEPLPLGSPEPAPQAGSPPRAGQPPTSPPADEGPVGTKNWKHGTARSPADDLRDPPPPPISLASVGAGRPTSYQDRRRPARTSRQLAPRARVNLGGLEQLLERRPPRARSHGRRHEHAPARITEPVDASRRRRPHPPGPGKTGAGAPRPPRQPPGARGERRPAGPSCQPEQGLTGRPERTPRAGPGQAPRAHSTRSADGSSRARAITPGASGLDRRRRARSPSRRVTTRPWMRNRSARHPLSTPIGLPQVPHFLIRSIFGPSRPVGRERVEEAGW